MSARNVQTPLPLCSPPNAFGDELQHVHVQKDIRRGSEIQTAEAQVVSPQNIRSRTACTLLPVSIVHWALAPKSKHLQHTCRSPCDHLLRLSKSSTAGSTTCPLSSAGTLTGTACTDRGSHCTSRQAAAFAAASASRHLVSGQEVRMDPRPTAGPWRDARPEAPSPSTKSQIPNPK